MNLPKIALLSLVMLSIAVISAAKSNDAETLANAEDPVLMTSANPPAQNSALPAQILSPLGLESSAPDLESQPVVEAGSCSSQSCGNTGPLFGSGNSCPAAKADLDQAMDNAAYNICPGVVIEVDRNYGNCSTPECIYSGNADITCKICAGQSCSNGGGA